MSRLHTIFVFAVATACSPHARTENVLITTTPAQSTFTRAQLVTARDELDINERDVVAKLRVKLGPEHAASSDGKTHLWFASANDGCVALRVAPTSKNDVGDISVQDLDPETVIVARPDGQNALITFPTSEDLEKPHAFILPFRAICKR
jgi:hypothetical protein